MSPSTIATVNAKVGPIVEKHDTTNVNKESERGPYLHLTPAQKYQVGKRAAETGVTKTLRYYAKNYPSILLKETSVRRLKNSYLSSLKDKKGEHSGDVQELPCKKMGRPLLIGEEPDKQVQEYVKYLRKCGSPINTAIVIATAEGIITSMDGNLLACNGGGISLTKDWAKSLLHRMGMVKRRASTKAKVSVDEFEKLKVGLCDNSDNAIIVIRKLILYYRYWLHYLSIIVNNYIAQYISALGDV